MTQGHPILGPGEMNPRDWQEHKISKWRPLKDRANPSALASVFVQRPAGAGFLTRGRQGFQRPESRSAGGREKEAWSWTLGTLDSASKT